MTDPTSKVIRLTKSQREAVAPLLEYLAQAEREDKPGMLVAQVFRSEMRVGVLSHEAGLLIQKHVNPKGVGRVTRGAYGHD